MPNNTRDDSGQERNDDRELERARRRAVRAEARYRDASREADEAKKRADKAERQADEARKNAAAERARRAKDVNERKRIEKENFVNDTREFLNSIKSMTDETFKDMEELRAKFMDETFDTLDRESKDYYNEELNRLSHQHEAELELYRKSFKALDKHLTQYDKDAFVIFYKNRRDDFRKMEREFRDRLGDMMEEAEDALEDFEEEFEEFQNSTLDWVNALNLNDLKNGLLDSSQSTVEIERELAKSMGFSSQELEKIREMSKTIANETGDKINVAEVEQIFASLGELGISDEKDLENYARVAVKTFLANGIEVSNMEDLINADRELNLDARTIQAIGDGIKALQRIEVQTSQGWQSLDFSSSSLNDFLNEMAPSLSSISVGGQAITGENYEKLIQSMTAASAVSSEYFGDAIDTIVKEIAESSENDADLITKYSILGLSPDELRRQLYQGNAAGVYKAIAGAVGSAVNSGMAEQLKESGIGDLGSLSNEDFAKMQRIGGNLEDFNSTMDQAVAAMESSNGAMDDFIKDMSIGIANEWMNKFQNSDIGMAITNFFASTGLDTTDVLLGGSLATDIINMFRGGKGKGGKGIFGKLLGSFKNYVNGGKGAVGAASAAAKASTKANYLSALSGSSKIGFRTTGAGAAAAAKGSGILSKIAGVGGKALRGAGPLSILGGLIDAGSGVMSNSSWFGDNANVGTGIASGLGGFLGGTGPGLMDEGSALDKGLNVGGGALKGAGIGALIGSVVPGLGTAIGGAVGAGVGAVGSAIGGENIAKFFASIPDKVGEAFNFVKDKATDFGNWLGGGANHIKEGLSENGIPGAISAINDNLRDFPVVGPVITGVENAFTNLAYDISNSPVGQAVGEFVGNVQQGAQDLWNDLVNSPVGQAVQDFAGKISQGAQDIWNNITTFAGNIAQGAQDLLKGIGDIAGQAVNWIGETAGKVGDWFSKNIGEPVANWWGGVTETAGKAWDGITGAVGGAWDYVTGLFKDPNERNKVGGTGSFAGGISNVPRDNVLSILHKGESVLTADQAKSIRSDGGIDVSGAATEQLSSLNSSTTAQLSIETGIRDKVSEISSGFAEYKKASKQSDAQMITKLNTIASNTAKTLSNTASTISSTATITSAIDKLKEQVNKVQNDVSDVNDKTKNLPSLTPSTTASQLSSILTRSGRSYDVGSNYIQSDQIALIHRGEMVVPAEFNPYANPGDFRNYESDEGHGDNEGTREIVQTLQWMTGRLEKRLEAVENEVKNSGARGSSYSSERPESMTDIVFQF